MLVYLQKKEPKLSVELLMDNLRYLLALDKECFIAFKDMKSQSIKNFGKKKKIYEKFEQVMHLMDDPKFPGAAAPLNRYWI